jgi:hypothetical protein
LVRFFSPRLQQHKRDKLSVLALPLYVFQVNAESTQAWQNFSIIPAMICLSDQGGIKTSKKKGQFPKSFCKRLVVSILERINLCVAQKHRNRSGSVFDRYSTQSKAEIGTD